MNSLNRIVRSLIWGILVGWTAWLVRRWLSPSLGGATTGPRRDSVRKAILLHRDPYCGTYVSPEISFPFEQTGQTQHFCSAECRDRYLRSERRAASA